MMLILFAICFALIGFSLFSFTTKINCINRAVINTPIEIFKTSIPLTEITSENIYFIKEEIEDKLDAYYKKTTSQHTNDFTFDLYFYNPEDESLCISNFCHAVLVKTTCTINGLYHYQREMSYQIYRR